MTNNETNKYESEQPEQAPTEIPQNNAITNATRCYNLLLGAFVAVPLYAILGPGFAIGFIALICIAIACISYSLIAIIRIKRSNGTLCDNGFIKPAILLPIIIIIAIACFLPAINMGFQMYMGSTLGTPILYLGEAVLEYTQDHNGNLPNLNKWCDEIKNNQYAVDAFPEFDPESQKCCFAINMHLPANTQDIPLDMVLLYQSQNGWNQAGGLELLPGEEYRSVAILFVDGHEEIFGYNDVKHLKWKLQDSGIIPQPNKPLLYSITTAILAVLSLAVIIYHRKYINRFWKMAFFLAVISACTGAFFGFWSQALYLTKETQHIGIIAGIPTGIIIAICYSLLVARAYANKKNETSITGYATLSGAITGILCSTIVHIFLMITYKETSTDPLLAGTPFGAWAGVTLGWITAGILSLYSEDITDPALISDGGE